MILRFAIQLSINCFRSFGHLYIIASRFILWSQQIPIDSDCKGLFDGNWEFVVSIIWHSFTATFTLTSTLYVLVLLSLDSTFRPLQTQWSLHQSDCPVRARFFSRQRYIPCNPVLPAVHGSPGQLLWFLIAAIRLTLSCLRFAWHSPATLLFSV